MTDFTAKIPDADTTYRVPDNSTAGLKYRALAAYFAPDEIAFVPANSAAANALKDGHKIDLYATATTHAILDRLDTVLGPGNWSEFYDTLPSGMVRCTLSMRFTAEGGWVDKCGVGAGVTDKSAATEAFERAAVKWGVGRYLYTLPPFACEWSAALSAPKVRPELPQACLPTKYRKCEPGTARRFCDIAEAVFNSAKIGRDDQKRFLAALLAEYGYNVLNLKTDLVKVLNRDIDAITQRFGEWGADIAAGRVMDSPHAPKMAEPPKSAPTPAPVQTEPPKSPPPNQPAPTSQTQPGKLTKPATGAELVARLEIKDAQLAGEGRMVRDALKAEILSKGVALGLSADMTRWTGNTIDSALKWAQEFIDSLPAPGTHKNEPRPNVPAQGDRGRNPPK